ncbi:E3 ubiquitin-protein ligase TM129-like [Mya arenaria]|uniref:E3 ubiquitin-protein ligase TM129-like n=1 Tax=Mya arenaria TaxID=6604 RepID=UPI0022E02545|nr:E3 ubiquitin-protein ligase TM129-like [Mya arenaria]
MLETKALLLFTFMYFFFSALLVAPPTEFISAGLTIQNVLSRYLGSEQIGFVYFHIKRTSATLIFHSLLPLCYYIALGLFAPQLQLFTPWLAPFWCQVLLSISLTLVSAACLVVLYWSQNKWDNHPIARQLDNLKEPESNWRAVASSVNVEFRRIDKFTSGPPTGRRIIVTDSWVIKTSTYFVHVAHQSDIHLSLSATEEHNISYENMTSVQYIHIDVISINKNISRFTLRLNALDYKDLKEKLQSPVRNARNIVIRQTLSEQFLHAFAEQISLNPVFHPPPSMEVDTCIGCMQKQSDINLYKRCESPEPGQPVPEGSGEPCVQCYCRPMWCLECMGKWFASRQDQQRPDTWLGSKSPCPTCRAVFCILDVCKIEW